MNSFDIGLLTAAEKLSIGYTESWRRIEAELAPKGTANVFYAEDFDLKPLSANCALRRERRESVWRELVLLEEKHANEELFYLCSKHSRTSEDSIFFRESIASRMETCLMFRSSKNELIEIALLDASSGMMSWEKFDGS